jgi:hypothetical protein
MADTTMDVRHTPARVESNVTLGHFPLISWRSVLAGFLIALLTDAALFTLGLGIGGLSLVDTIQDNSSGNALAIGSGFWIVLCTVVSLFTGAYFAARVSNYITGRIGAAQGMVIASVFFLFMALNLAITLGATTRGVSGIVSAVGGGVADLSRNQQVRRIADQLIVDKNLKSDPDVVIGGVVSRLASGNSEGAKSYLANQAGMTRAEADQRINQISAQLNSALKDAGVAAGRVVSTVGWTLFGLIILGSLFSCLGGALGSRANFRHPLARDISHPVGELHPAY